MSSSDKARKESVTAIRNYHVVTLDQMNSDLGIMRIITDFFEVYVVGLVLYSFISFILSDPFEVSLENSNKISLTSTNVTTGAITTTAVAVASTTPFLEQALMILVLYTIAAYFSPKLITDPLRALDHIIYTFFKVGRLDLTGWPRVSIACKQLPRDALIWGAGLTGAYSGMYLIALYNGTINTIGEPIVKSTDNGLGTHTRNMIFLIVSAISCVNTLVYWGVALYDHTDSVRISHKHIIPKPPNQDSASGLSIYFYSMFTFVVFLIVAPIIGCPLDFTFIIASASASNSVGDLTFLIGAAFAGWGVGIFVVFGGFMMLWQSFMALAADATEFVYDAEKNIKTLDDGFTPIKKIKSDGKKNKKGGRNGRYKASIVPPIRFYTPIKADADEEE